MQIFSNRILFTLVIYLLLITFLLIIQPSCLFYDTGELKPFGSGEGKTLFSFSFVALLSPFIIYYTFAMIDLMTYRSKK